MPLILLLAFIGVPIAEIGGFIVVGREIGLWPTLGLVVATAMIGTFLLRQQGMATLRRAEAAIARGEPPAGPLFDAACLLVGGVLLLTPGFLTDAFGLALMIPSLRTWIGRGLWAMLRGRIQMQTWQQGQPPPGQGRPGGAAPTIDGDYREADETQPDADDPDLPPVDRSQWRPPTRRP